VARETDPDWLRWQVTYPTKDGRTGDKRTMPFELKHRGKGERCLLRPKDEQDSNWLLVELVD
jgi:hypothetical protein